MRLLLRNASYQVADSWWAAHHATPRPDHPEYDNIHSHKPLPRNNWRIWLTVKIVSCILIYALIWTATLGPELGALMWWLWASVANYAYVTYVTTHRPGPWKGRFGGMRDLVVVIILSPIIWAVSVAPLSKLLFDPTTLFGNAYFWLSLVFLELGTHVSYVHYIPALGASVTGKGVQADKSLAAMAIFKLSPVAYFVYLHLCYIFSNEMTILISLYGVLFSSIAIITSCIKDTYHWHLHHYLVGILGSFLSLHDYEILAIMTAHLFHGFFIEGAARWSCAPLWHRRVR